MRPSFSALLAARGEIFWPAGNTTSPVLAGDTLIATNEDGKTFLIRAADEFVLEGENDLGETVYASPALLDGRLYFRTAENVICIGE